MGNCLKTQLKESVSNDNLFTIDGMKISVVSLASITDGENQQKLLLSGNDNITIRVPSNSDGYFALSLADLNVPANRKTSYTITSSTNLYFPNIDFDVILEGKSHLTTLRTYNANNIFKVNVNSIVSPSMNDCKLALSKSYGDIKFVSNIKNTAALNLNGCSEIYGDIVDLAAIFKSNSIVLAFTKIEGTVESLVEEIWTNKNKRTNSFNLNVFSTPITLHSTAVENAISIAFSNEGVSISDSGNVVATYNGSTWTYA